MNLGVTAVGAVPVHHFDPPHLLERGLVTYWGYNSIGYFAPHAGYSAAVRRGERGGQVREFQEMVAALHQAGIEVILDVVYNHTAEGENGPMLCSGASTTTATTGSARTRRPTRTTPAAATP